MGFFDRFKKPKEDKFDKQIAEMQAKNAALTAQKQADAAAGDKAAADTLKKAEDYAGIMNAFTAFSQDTAGAPVEMNTKYSFKSDGTYAQKKVIKVSAEADAAFDDAAALFDERGEWDEDVFDAYKNAADLGQPYACMALGEYLMESSEEEQAQPYLEKARAYGLKC